MVPQIFAYTAVFGNFDTLFAAPRVKGVDFVCFTNDVALRAKGRKLIVSEAMGIDALKSARFYKAFPHRYFSDYQFSIWMDGTHCLRRDPKELLSFCGTEGIALHQHPDRSCIYEEAEACIQRGFNEQTIRHQMARYISERYPERNGLAQTTVIVRRHTSPTVIAAMEHWWREIDLGSVRDQLSFD